MKRLLIAIAASVMLALGWLGAEAQAQPILWPSLQTSLALSFPGLHLADAAPAATKDLLVQLENEILPQLETILMPDQRESFKTAIADGVSFRKAFKSIALTPGQKEQLKTLLQSLPKKDAFASLTPAQKKQLFIKNKDAFMPTADEISEKISAGVKAKGGSLPPGLNEKINGKINAGMKQKGSLLPTPAEINQIISEKMTMIKAKLAE